MDLIGLIGDYLGRVGAWAFTLSGFIILVCLGLLIAAALLVIKHFIFHVKNNREAKEARIVALEAQVKSAVLEVKIALAECQMDGHTDKAFISSWRLLAVKYRALCSQLMKIDRRAWPDVDELELEYQALRLATHDDNNRRIARMKERVLELERESARDNNHD